MTMLKTHASDPVYVSAVHARRVVKLRIGPSKIGAACITELKPSEARKIALFQMQVADKIDAA